jgi:hypothetical protein
MAANALYDAAHEAGNAPWQSPPRGYRLGLEGYYRPDRASLLLSQQRPGPSPQARMLGWLRDHVHKDLPRAYYDLVLGHDLHIATYAELYVRQHHAHPELPMVGWWEDIGRVSRDKVTTAFRDFEAANLVAELTTYGDFKYHEVGLSTTAEANTQTGLLTSTGIVRVAGTQTNPTASTYQSVAVITADTVETWAEHGIFNALSGQVMLDRSLLSPTIAVQVNDSVEFTYILTKSAEP